MLILNEAPVDEAAGVSAHFVEARQFIARHLCGCETGAKTAFEILTDDRTNCENKQD